MRAAVAFGARRWSVIRKVVLPSALPMIFAGLRLGAGTALLLLVAAEMIAVESGIGFLVLHAGNLMATTKLMVGLVVLSAAGRALALGLDRAGAARHSLARAASGGSACYWYDELLVEGAVMPRLLAVALLGLLLLSAAAAPAQDQVKVGVLKLTSSAPIFVGVEKGFFKEFGVEPELVYFQAAAPIATALAAGQIDVGATGLTAALYNIVLGGEKLWIVADKGREWPGYPLDRASSSRRSCGTGGLQARSATSRASASASPSSARPSTTISATSSRRKGSRSNDVKHRAPAGDGRRRWRR